MSISTTIATVIDSGVTTRDGIIIALVTDHGVTLNAATKAYAEYAKQVGLTTAVTSHKAAALEFLGSEYAGHWTADSVRDAVIELQDKFDVAESTARDYCKAYSDTLGIAHPTANPRDLIFAWFKAHAGDCTKAQFMHYAMEELGRSQSNANEYWKGYELHLHIIGQ